MSYITKNFAKVFIQVQADGREIFSVRDDRKLAFNYLWKRLDEIEWQYGACEITFEFY